MVSLSCSTKDNTKEKVISLISIVVLSGGWDLPTLFQLSTCSTKVRTDHPRDPLASGEGSIPIFFRKPIATCDFPGGGLFCAFLKQKYKNTYYCSSPWGNMDHICIVNKVVGIGIKLSIFPLINRGGNIYTDRWFDIL